MDWCFIWGIQGILWPHWRFATWRLVYRDTLNSFHNDIFIFLAFAKNWCIGSNRFYVEWFNLPKHQEKSKYLAIMLMALLLSMLFEWDLILRFWTQVTFCIDQFKERNWIINQRFITIKIRLGLYFCYILIFYELELKLIVLNCKSNLKQIRDYFSCWIVKLEK